MMSGPPRSASPQEDAVGRWKRIHHEVHEDHEGCNQDFSDEEAIGCPEGLLPYGAGKARRQESLAICSLGRRRAPPLRRPICCVGAYLVCAGRFDVAGSASAFLPGGCSAHHAVEDGLESPVPSREPASRRKAPSCRSVGVHPRRCGRQSRVTGPES